MDNFCFSLPRTDMADEAHKLWSGRAEEKGKLKGLRSSKEKLKGLDISCIEILDEFGERAIGKARGRYFSIELPQYFDRCSEDFTSCVDAVSELILRCIDQKVENVLVAALGNPDISPDALGNICASSILVTRHLDRNIFPQFNCVSLCRPGVLGTSGIESAEQVKCITDFIAPQLVIVVDALAGSDANRLCRCIQISDAGICPGSGVGNDRRELSKGSLGIPVISIGIPTVIDASYFGKDDFKGMFVTPRNIDSLVRWGARLIAYGINLAVHNSLSVEDIDSLLG